MRVGITILGIAAFLGLSEGRATDDFLFVIVEDQSANRYWSSVRPNPTASLERLAGSGTVFKQAYCPATVCNAARTALLTCRPPDQTGVLKNKDDSSKLPTALHHLKDHGYNLMATGKIFHNGFEQNRVFAMLAELKPWSGGGVEIELETSGSGTAMQIGVSEARAEEGAASVHADGLIRLIESADSDRKNGFLIGFTTTHLPFFVPNSRRYADAYDGSRVRLPLSDWFERPFASPQNRKFRISMQKRKEVIARYNGCLRYASDQAARVIRAFRERFPEGHAIFLSDHGFLMDEGRCWGKPSTMEAAARVPYFVWSNQLPAGEIEGPISTGTAFPLLLDLCGVPPFEAAHWKSPRKSVAESRKTPGDVVVTYATNRKQFRETRGDKVIHFQRREKYLTGLDDRPPD